MADSIPKLRRLLNEANERIRELEAMPPVEVEKVVYRDVPVTVPGPVVNTPREVVTIERVVYQDNPDHIETIRKLQEKLCQYTSQLDS